MKIVCPYCFEKFSPSEVLYRCTNVSASCTNEKDEAMNKFWGDSRLYKRIIRPKKSLFGGMPKSAKCSCGNESQNTVCPHCHNDLPREMVEKGGTIISIVGAWGSGKTTYITTLIYELTQKGHSLNIGALPTFVGISNDECTGVRYENDFFNILYKQKVCPGATKLDYRCEIPLIYKLYSTAKDKHIYLVFHDKPGEYFHDTKKCKNILNNSDGIIMLMDIFDEQAGHNNLIQNIISYFDEQPDNYKKPFAIALSKIDAVISNNNTPLPGISLNANSGYLDGGGYDVKEMESVDMSIRAGLESWGEKPLIDNINAQVRFNRKAKFFGISALGSSPNDRYEIEKIKPFRVLDPLIWILYSLKFPLLIKK